MLCNYMQPRDHHDCISVVSYNGITSSIANQFFCQKTTHLTSVNRLDTFLKNIMVYYLNWEEKKPKILGIELQQVQFQMPTKKPGDRNGLHLQWNSGSYQEKSVIHDGSHSPKEVRLLLLHVLKSSQ